MTSASLPGPVGIVGLGLIGGSLARALAATDDAPEVVGWSRDADDLAVALDEGVIGSVAETPQEVARKAGLVVYAAPLNGTLGMLEAHRGLWRPDAVLTDVSSLKESVVDRARASGVAERFVGAHPMAGGEGSGYRAGRADLFQGATVWITTDTGGARVGEVVAELWRSVGGVPRLVDARGHDQRMIWASHLPQLISNALAHVLEERGLERGDLGPGGRGMTRLAGSSPEMWIDLFEDAGAGAARALDVLGGALNHLARDLRDGRLDEVAELMGSTRRWSRAVQEGWLEGDGRERTEGRPR